MSSAGPGRDPAPHDELETLNGAGRDPETASRSVDTRSAFGYLLACFRTPAPRWRARFGARSAGFVVQGISGESGTRACIRRGSFVV